MSENNYNNGYEDNNGYENLNQPTEKPEEEINNRSAQTDGFPHSDSEAVDEFRSQSSFSVAEPKEEAQPSDAAQNVNSDSQKEYDYKNTQSEYAFGENYQTAADSRSAPAQNPDYEYHQGRNTQANSPYAQYPVQNGAPKYNTYGTDYNKNAYPQNPYYQAQPNGTNRKAKKKKNTKQIAVSSLVLIIAVTVFASAVLGFGGGMLANSLNKSSPSDGLTINKVVTTATPSSSDTAELTTTQISEMTADSVVEIVTEVVETSPYYQQYISSGAGSGVIISDDGYIITNNHVIDGASTITVTLRDGNDYSATLIGTDSEVDIALLKIEPEEELTVAVFGDSSTLKVGDKTVVIGNPLGQLGGTVTDGIISALDRDVTIDGQTRNLLQTNAAINPGNSGGGMFNSQGELVGVIVAKSVDTTIEGLGFAIPINDVLDVLDDLMQYGYVRGRVSLGVTLVDVTSSQMAMMYGVSELGCYVSSVDLNSNASNAGLQSGDRIISINGAEISASEEVVNFMDTVSVGDTLEIEVSRNGRTGTLSVVLQEDIPDGISSNDSSLDNYSSGSSEGTQDNGSSKSILKDILDKFGF